jgi:hypothetical protein
VELAQWITSSPIPRATRLLDGDRCGLEGVGRTKTGQNRDRHCPVPRSNHKRGHRSVRRKRRAGLPVPPFLPSITTPLISDDEWNELIRKLGRSNDQPRLRAKLDHHLDYYLSFVLGEANAPSEREAAIVLSELTRRCEEFKEGVGGLFAPVPHHQNSAGLRLSAGEVALWLLKGVKDREGVPVLARAQRAVGNLARAAAEQAHELEMRAGGSRRRRRGRPTLWALGRLCNILSEEGYSTRLPHKNYADKAEDDPAAYPFFSVGRWFLHVARNRLRQFPPEHGARGCKELTAFLNLGALAFVNRLGAARLQRGRSRFTPRPLSSIRDLDEPQSGGTQESR